MMKLTRSVVVLILGIIALTLSFESNAELDGSKVSVSQSSQAGSGYQQAMVR